MISRTLSLDDLKGRTWEEVLTVRLSEGETVAIQRTPDLKPLPVLEGFVPEGWKDAVYD